MSTRRNPEHTKDYVEAPVGPNSVKIFAADGITQIGFISADALRKRRKSPIKIQHAPTFAPPAAPHPAYRERRAKGKERG